METRKRIGHVIEKAGLQVLATLLSTYVVGLNYANLYHTARLGLGSSKSHCPSETSLMLALSSQLSGVLSEPDL